MFKFSNFITNLVIFYTLSIFISQASSHLKDDFCERDEKTGACKSSVSQPEAHGDGPCWEDKEKVKPKDKRGKLVRLDGVKVGHVQQTVIDGKTYKLITKAMRPLLFEIPNFITADEAEAIKDQADLLGLFSSIAKGGLTERDYYKPVSTAGRSQGPSGTFVFWDWNSDGIIEMQDILNWTRYHSFLILNETDILEMFKAIDDHTFDDGIITKEEFLMLNSQGVDDYLNTMVRVNPRFRQRFSDQTFLPMSRQSSPTIHEIRERVVKLTKLSRKIVYEGEHLQVVRYGVHGHYHAHHDSETHTRTDKPCCHQTSTETVQEYATCRLCRFITFMLYLNDVEEGGETAFPVADNATYSAENLRKKGETASEVKDSYNLSHFCKDANVVLKPRMGTAVMWYNHMIDDENGWLGEMEERGLHGGCDVKKGEKWIANIWLTAPYANDIDSPSMYFNEKDYLYAEKAYA